MTSKLLSLVLLAAIARAEPVSASQELTRDNFPTWYKYIRPSEKEQAWRKVSWRNKLMTAVAEAEKLERPVLLWAMNGNPCGET